jgi:ketosteroid isomerase-like protein
MKELVRSYFEALQKKDFDTLYGCYTEDFRFEDPAMGKLEGRKAKNAWRMYAESLKDLRIVYRIVQLDTVENTAWVHWDAYYTSPESGKTVFNKIDTHFDVRDGKFCYQHDDFILKDWAKQTMGLKARLFGGTRAFQKRVVKRSNEKLESYLSQLKD